MLLRKQQFQFLEKIGKGSSGSIYLANYKKYSKEVAVKIDLKQDFIMIQRQINIHQSLFHPNIITFYGSFIYKKKIYIVMEYASCLSVFKQLKKRQSFSQIESIKYWIQTAQALQYLHSKDIMHRDIKPENLLLDQKKNIKLCDFGWATININKTRKTFCGTYQYMSPEMVNGKPYDYRIDLWSLGILLFELTHGKPPFRGKTFPEIQKNINRNVIQFKPDISQQIKTLILKLTENNPDNRISIEQALNFNIIKRFNKQQLNCIKKIQSYMNFGLRNSSTSSPKPKNFIRRKLKRKQSIPDNQKQKVQSKSPFKKIELNNLKITLEYKDGFKSSFLKKKHARHITQ